MSHSLKYLYNNSGTMEFATYATNILLPYTMAFKNNETPDSAAVELISANETPLPRGTVVRIQRDSDYNEFVIDTSKSTPLATQYIHTYGLLEMVELAKEKVLPNLAFKVGNYTIAETHARLLRQAKLTDWELSDTDTTFTGADNYQYDFSDKTLYDAIFEIGNSFGKLPKVKYDVATEKYQIYYVNKLGDRTSTFSLTELDEIDNKEINYTKDTYAGKVISNVSNMLVDERQLYPADGLGVKLITEETNTTITTTNAIFRTEKIQQLDFLYLIVKKRIIESTDTLDPTYGEYSYYSDGSDSFYGVQIDDYDRTTVKAISQLTSDIKVLEYKAYLEAGSPSNALYYKQFENKVTNFSALSSADDVTIGYKYDTGLSVWEAVDVTPTITNTIWLCLYYPVVNTMFKTSNQNDSVREVLYNQSDNLVDSEKYINSLQSYADSLVSKNQIRNATFTTYASIKKVGEVSTTGEIIDELSVTVDDKYYCIYNLSDYYSKKSDFIGADQQIKNFNVPLDKTLDRKIHLYDILKISVGTSITNANTAICSDELSNLIGALKTQDTKAIDLVAFNFDNSNYLLKSITKSQDGTNISFIINAYSNSLWDFKNSSGSLLPISYIDSNGEITNMSIRFFYSDDYVQLGYDTLGDLIDMYPVISSTEWGYIDTIKYFDTTVQIDKDALEKLGIIYQIQYLGVNDTLVNKNMVKLSDFVSPNSNTIYVDFLNKRYTQYDGKPIAGDIIQTNTVTIIYGAFITYTLNSAAPSSYESLVIRRGDNPLLVSTYKITGTQFNIYFSCESGD